MLQDIFGRKEKSMNQWLGQLSPLVQTLIATLFTWGMTAMGAATVFFFKNTNQKVMDGMLGFSAGVMVAASFWSLLEPSIEAAGAMGVVKWLPATLGFLAGGLFLRLVDRFLPHFHIEEGKTEGIKTSWSRTVLLALAITMHNIPEGLSVGVGFGAAGLRAGGANVAGAAVLALGIGIQNFPEGAAVSLPLRRQGMSRWKSFFYGQLSGVVEPIAAVIGVLLVTIMQPLMPYALAFAAGAMIYVVADEVVPEANMSGNGHLATMGTMIGFAVMMMLDVMFS